MLSTSLYWYCFAFSQSHFHRFRIETTNLFESRRPRTNRDRMLADIIEKVDFKRPINGTVSITPLEEDPEYPMVKTAITAGSSRKALSITAMRISHMTEITDFMVILEGNSRPQNQAIGAHIFQIRFSNIDSNFRGSNYVVKHSANTIEEEILRLHAEEPSKQGNAAGGWILLDYGRLIVHVMTPQMRNFYKLESKWKTAEIVDVDSILGEDMMKPKEFLTDPDNSMNEEDPFWA